MRQLPLPQALLPDLDRVDAIIGERAAEQASVLQLAGPYVLASGQTRIRAALTLLAAQLGHYDLSRVLHSAAAAELIHAAALVHDDLIDGAERRRGRLSAQPRWDGDVSLMVGDYLFALAAAEMALAPDPRIIAYFSRAVMTISEGQLAPVRVLTPLSEALDQYLSYIGGKTAALFEAGCKAGIVCGGGDQSQIDALGRFGYALGLAFQIVDHVIDITHVDALPGKRVGGALRRGEITLPLIYAMDANPDPALASVIDLVPPDEERIRWAIGEIGRTGAQQRALADAEGHIARALASLDSFPNSPARQALHDIARFVLERAA